MMRQISKQNLRIAGKWSRNIGFLLLFATSFGVQASNSRLLSDFVIDPLSGVAIGGFDPVSYFTDAEPLQGRPDFEVIWKGVPWFFSSEGNMEIFVKAPEVYAPQYGGHGVMSLARGFLSDGNPMIYRVLDNRLYLFYSFSNRTAFELTDKMARVNAITNWENLRVAQDNN